MPATCRSGVLQAVTFDCWSTLIYEPDPMGSLRARVEGFTTLLGELGLDTVSARAEQALNHAWQRHATAWMNGQHAGAAEVARWALEPFHLRERDQIDRLRTLLEDTRAQVAIGALEGAADTLRALRQAGIRLGLICDTGLTPGRRVRQMLSELELLSPLETLVFSDELGVPKPSPLAFRAALHALGVEAEHAVHVGDLRRTDVAGARAVGMGTIRLRHHHDDLSDHPDADLIADSHAHLQHLLLA